MKAKGNSNEGRYLIASPCDDGMHPEGYYRIVDTKTNSLISIVDDYTMAAGLVKSLNRLTLLEVENGRLFDALDYIYQSGDLGRHTEQKARWGLGLYVENEENVAALKPRFS